MSLQGHRRQQQREAHSWLEGRRQQGDEAQARQNKLQEDEKEQSYEVHEEGVENEQLYGG